MGSFPGGRVGSPGGGVGLGVDCGVCASAALVPASKTLDRITDLTKVRDVRVNINEQLLKSDPSGSQVQVNGMSDAILANQGPPHQAFTTLPAEVQFHEIH
jgi:hypothetical protein